MSNFNANSINVKTLNFTGNHMYHRGTPIKLLDEDISGNLCLLNDLYPNNPLEIGINICPGTTVISNLPNPQPPGTIEAKQIMSAALDISGAIQLAFGNDLSTAATNNLGQIAFFPDSSNNYRFWGCEESRNPDGTVSHDTWRLLTSSFANQAYWTQTGNDLYYDGGNVGIGLTDPTEKLDVSGNVKIRGYLDMSCNRIIDISGIYFCDASGSSITGGNSLDISSNTVYFKNKGGTIPILLDVSGDISCNNLDANVSNYKNQIGSFASGFGALNINSTAIGSNCSASNQYSIAMGQNTVATNNNSTAMGGSTTASGAYSTAMGIYSNASTNYSTAIGNRAFAGGTIQFAVGSSPGVPPSIATSSSNNNKFVILTTGNVGIGTDNPTTTLDVSGNVKIRGYLDMSCNRIIDISGISFCSDSSGIDMSCNSIIDVSSITFCGHDGVGIDLSCNTIIDVSGIYFCDGSSFTYGNSLDISGDGISFLTNGDGTEQMKILNGGNVGIGTTGPLTKLEVARLDSASDISNNLLRLSSQITTLGEGPSMEFYVKRVVGGYDRLTAAIEGELIEILPGWHGSGNLVFSTTNTSGTTQEEIMRLGPSAGTGITDAVVVISKSVGIGYGASFLAGIYDLKVNGSSYFNSAVHLNNALHDSATDSPGTAGQVLTSTITGTEWADEASSLWSQSGNDIFYDTGNVGIGTSTPSARLEVASGDALINTLTVGLGANLIDSNTVVGFGALGSAGVGIQNVAVGYQALLQNSGGQDNVAVGYLALQTSDTSYNTAVGSQALSTNHGNQNTAIGYQALAANSGNANVATGYAALAKNTGVGNVATGYAALTDNSGNYNTATGYFALKINTGGESNVATGYQALSSNKTGGDNVAIGYNALNSSDSSYNTAIGHSAGGGQTDFFNTINVGYGASCNASNTACIGNTDISCVYLGSISGYAKLDCSGITTTGDIDMSCNRIIDVSGIYFSDGSSFTHGDSLDISANTVHITNTNLIVDGSGLIQTLTVGLGGGDISSNTVVGYQALNANTTGLGNVATGYQALQDNGGNGNYNTATGYQALQDNSGAGYGNVATGAFALYKNGGNHSYNTAIGYQALQDNSGGYNTAIGYIAGKGQTDISNTINVGYDTSCNASNTVCIGNADISCVYLGSTSGNAKLDCSGITTTGDIDMSRNRIIDVSGIYFSDGSSFTHGAQGPGSTLWVQNGNNISFSAGDVGIGTSTPSAELDVSGNVIIGKKNLLPNGWADVTPAQNKPWTAIASASNGQKLFACGGSTTNPWLTSAIGNIWRSLNYGATWIEDTTVGAKKQWSGIASSDDGTKLAACDNGTIGAGAYIYTSSDSGGTWSHTNNDSPSKSWTCIASSANGTKLACAAEGDLVYISADSGATWTGHSVHSLGPGYSQWTSIASSANGTNLAVVACDGYVYTSSNSGSTWTQRAPPQNSWSSIASSADGTKLAASSFIDTSSPTPPNVGVVYLSSDAGVSWSYVLSTILPLARWMSITSTGDGLGLSVADASSGKIWNSRDGGTNWDEDSTLDTYDWYAITSSGVSLTALSSTGNSVTGRKIWVDAPFSNVNVVLEVSGNMIIEGNINNLTVGSGNGNVNTNTVVGHRALYENTTGFNNVAVGYQALYENTTGFNNVAMGYQALLENTDGSNNVAMGYQALLKNTDGSNNVAVGYQALYENTTGSNNVAMGYQALHENTNGSNNVAMGYKALLCTKYVGQGGSSVGFNNTAIGNLAGLYNEDGHDNIFIGYNAGVNPGGSSLYNTVVIGPNLTNIASNTVVLGNSSMTSYKMFGGNTWTQASDSRIKKNITDCDLGLDFINKLRPVKYNFVNPADWPEPLLEHRFKGDNPDPRPEDNTSVYDGLIAQEVEESLKQLGKTWSGHNVSGEMQGLQIASLTIPLVNAVQELTTKLAAMEARLDAAGI